MARRHGFDVTDAEIEQGWDEASGGELTPFELELVSAGASGGGADNSRCVSAY